MTDVLGDYLRPQDELASYFVAHQDRLMRRALQLTHDPQAAEDLVQDTWETALDQLHNFDGAYPGAWLVAILQHHVLNWRRAARFTASETETSDNDNLVRPEDAAVLADTIQHCLTFLTLGQREAIVAVDLDGLDYVAAADRLDIHIGTVRSRLARGRRRLKHCLQQEESE